MQNSNKLGFILKIDDKPGSLLSILSILKAYKVNISYLRSNPNFVYDSTHKKINIFMDIVDDNSSEVISAFKQIKNSCSEVQFNYIRNIPWFPQTLTDLNLMGRDILIGGQHIKSNHPGFNDQIYIKRRKEMERQSRDFQFSLNSTVPFVDYTDEETEIWTYMWNKLRPLIKQHACEEFVDNFEVLIGEKLFVANRIPQIADFNSFFKNKTGWFFRPTGGLLSDREFLNSLAFKVFPCTQYIRHSSQPDYTPEPDLIHELIGHASMFINESFSEFSQIIGLASLGVSDKEIKKLSAIYWFTIEVGLVTQNNKRKIYGGGILSSPTEIIYSISDKPVVNEFNMRAMSKQAYDLTCIQTNYYIAQSFSGMLQNVKEYAKSIPREFNVSYDKENEVIDIDRRISI